MWQHGKRYCFLTPLFRQTQTWSILNKGLPPEDVFAPWNEAAVHVSAWVQTLKQMNPFQQWQIQAGLNPRLTLHHLQSTGGCTCPVALCLLWCLDWCWAQTCVPPAPGEYCCRASGHRGSGWCWDGASVGSGMIYQQHVQANGLWLSSNRRIGCAVNTKQSEKNVLQDELWHSFYMRKDSAYLELNQDTSRMVCLRKHTR